MKPPLPSAAPIRCTCLGCMNTMRSGRLMCRSHWRRVPRALRAEVTESWRAYRRVRTREDFGPAIARYTAARQAALDAVGGGGDRP